MSNVAHLTPKSHAKEITIPIKPIKVTITQNDKTETKSVTELNLREPTIREVMNATKNTNTEHSENLQLLCSVTGLPMQIIEKIKLSDYKTATLWVKQFFNPDAPNVDLPAVSLHFSSQSVTHDGQKYTSIIIEEPEIGVLDDSIYKGGNDNMLSSLHLIAAVGKVPLAVAEKLPISEYVKASKYLSSFLSATSSTD